jgi:hypothetical protein
MPREGPPGPLASITEMLPRVIALPLGLLLALAIGACGSGGTKHTAVTSPPLSVATQASTPTTTATTATTTVQTTTTPAATTTTTTQTTTHASGGAAPTSTQPTGGAPAGCPSAVGGFIRDVRATDCGVATSVANAWFAAVHGGARPDSPIQAAGYSCDATMAGERASVSCTAAGGGSVAFTASP